MDLVLKCNSRVCSYCSLEGKAYRTKCGHVFCEPCAYSAFSDNNVCPVCFMELNDGDVNEFLIGISTGPVSKYLYQSAFQSNNWVETLKNVREILKSTLELVSWTNHQLLYEACKGTENYNGLKKESEFHKSNAIKIALQLKSQTISGEHKIKELERQLFTAHRDSKAVQDAFTEKSKKCDAWERAYNIIRQKGSVDNPEEYSMELNPSKLSSHPVAYVTKEKESIPYVMPGTFAQLRGPTPSTPTRIVKRMETTLYRQTTSSDGEFNPFASELYNRTSSQHQIYHDELKNGISKYFPSTNRHHDKIQEKPSALEKEYEPTAPISLSKKSFFTSRK